MGSIWNFIRRDARHLRASATAAVVAVGIIVVPSLYAWFNIQASWDPYGSTHELTVAVANDDEGYSSELSPIELNLGARVGDRLLRSDSIGYVSAAHDDAVEGVKAGRYYAAVIIPEDFSRRLMSGLSGDPRPAEVAFLQNQKENAIAQIVTGKAATAVERDIDRDFSAAVSETGAGALDELGRLLDDGQVGEVASNLADAVAGARQTLADGAGAARSLAGSTASAQGLLEASAATFDGLAAPGGELQDAIGESAEGLRGLDDAIEDARSMVDGALESSGAGLEKVSSAVSTALDAIAGPTERLTAALGDVNAEIERESQSLGQLSGDLASTIEELEAREATAEEGSAEAHAVARALAALRSLADRVDQAINELENLSLGIETTLADLARTSDDVQAAREQIAGLVEQAGGQIDAARGAYADGLKGSLGRLADDIDAANRSVTAITDGLSGAAGAVQGAAASASEELAAAHGALEDAASGMEEQAGRMSEIEDGLRQAVAGGDTSELRAILSATPNDLGAFMASPVTVERHPVFPVENNGSAMAPFYTVLSIWIGGVIISALLLAEPSDRALDQTGCTPNRAYAGRLITFCALGVAQATLICAGDVLVLGVQCAHPVLFWLAGAVASIVFINIIFALAATFGDVGKAVAVILMVLQVAGAGGTFPPQMLPPVFQAVYPWLPFVHAEGALRAAIFGIYGNDLWIELGTLALYLLPSLALGLALRTPAKRVGRRVEHALERTGVM